MTRYAKATSVSTRKSRDEIETTLRRYGADQFAYGWREEHAVIGFRMDGRQIKFTLPLPKRAEFARTPTKGDLRAPEAIEAAWEQACRQRWRALALVIKAKLEAVETGITLFEDEFLAHIVMPGGQTVGDIIKGNIAIAYETGRVPALLEAPKS